MTADAPIRTPAEEWRAVLDIVRVLDGFPAFQAVDILLKANQLALQCAVIDAPDLAPVDGKTALEADEVLSGIHRLALLSATVRASSPAFAAVHKECGGACVVAGTTVIPTAG
jgi:hypothetical protein